jgi:hypothetical protein
VKLFAVVLLCLLSGCHLIFGHDSAGPFPGDLAARRDHLALDRGPGHGFDRGLDRSGDRRALEAGNLDASPADSPAPGVKVSTIAGDGVAGKKDGPALQAQFDRPANLAFDEAGALGVPGALYISEEVGHRVRRLHNGVVSLVAGTTVGYLDGPGASAKLDGPAGLAIHGSVLYVADMGNNRIRKVSFDGSGYKIGTAAGTGASGSLDGPAPKATLSAPHDLVVTSSGSLLIAEYLGHRIRELTLATALVGTVAGNGIAATVDGSGLDARLNAPVGLGRDAVGAFYVGEHGGKTIRKLVLPGGQVSTLSGVTGKFGSLEDAVSTPLGVFVVSWGAHVILRLDPVSGAATVIAGQSGVAGFANGPGSSALFHGPHGIIAVSGSTGTALLVADYENNRVRRIELP